MKSVKELRERAASRPRKKSQVYSTSEARANFAEALESAQMDSAVIGFDRYGRTIAALVPIEAVFMLAGKGREVAPEVRKRIEAEALLFTESVPNRVGRRRPPVRKKAAKKSKPKKSAKKKSPKNR